MNLQASLQATNLQQAQRGAFPEATLSPLRLQCPAHPRVLQRTLALPCPQPTEASVRMQCGLIRVKLDCLKCINDNPLTYRTLDRWRFARDHVNTQMSYSQWRRQGGDQQVPWPPLTCKIFPYTACFVCKKAPEKLLFLCFGLP
jgi:hypothetical protein